MGPEARAISWRQRRSTASPLRQSLTRARFDVGTQMPEKKFCPYDLLPLFFAEACNILVVPCTITLCSAAEAPASNGWRRVPLFQAVALT